MIFVMGMIAWYASTLENVSFVYWVVLTILASISLW